MECPWLALEVLRELHEANARYFALTLHSPRSRYCLVSLWCPSTWHREDANLVLPNNVRESRVLTNCRVCGLTPCVGWWWQEIPATFTAETGWPSEEECALVTSMSTLKEWPLQIRRLHPVLPGVSAVSIGGGWPKFVADHNLGVGAFLTFEVVDTRRLVASIHNRSASPVLHHEEHVHGDVVDEGDLPERDYSEAGGNQHTHSPVLPEAHGDERPQFRKTLRKTHTLKNDSSKLVSGTPIDGSVVSHVRTFRGFFHFQQRSVRNSNSADVLCGSGFRHCAVMELRSLPKCSLNGCRESGYGRLAN